MEADWDERARRNAKYFIHTEASQSDAEFRESGEQDVERILSGVELPRDARVLEIGCGIGRLLEPMSRRVERVEGVDISQEMITRTQEHLRGIPNVGVHHTRGDLSMFADETFDFAYCILVFQHITERRAIERYFREVARVLKPGGRFRFHIPVGKSESAARSTGGTWFGVLLTEREIREELARAGYKDILFHDRAQTALWESSMVTCHRPDP
jgi:cyclopropane fatty-acyl-phospholipid synthase-like methyltransferase